MTVSILDTSADYVMCLCFLNFGDIKIMICFNFSRHLYLRLEKKHAQQVHPWGGPPCWKVVTQWSPLPSPHRRWTLRWWMCPRHGRDSGEWSDAWKDTKCTCFKIVISYSILFHIHPERLIWNLKITHLERNMIFQTSTIMFHVSLQGCSVRKVRDVEG